MSIKTENFAHIMKLANGQYIMKESDKSEEVLLYTLENKNGMRVDITNFGATIVSIFVPDKNGIIKDVVLGYDSLEGYLKNPPYFGSIIGRHANRLENACFELNGRTYSLAANSGSNNLHGGIAGFDKALWKGSIISQNAQKNTARKEALQLDYLSRDGEEGFPGNLETKVVYAITDDNALVIDYFAVSDKDTVVNLTNHTYFNLAGHASGCAENHIIAINAKSFTKTDEQGIPNGEIADVKGTPMDFTSPVRISDVINQEYDQIRLAGGFDHNWILDINGYVPEKAAELLDPESGRALEVLTTKPGVQFYSGNFLNGTEKGKDGVMYGKKSGLCLETQYFPNSMKHKHFPSPVLKCGQQYHHTTIFRFKVRY